MEEILKNIFYFRNYSKFNKKYKTISLKRYSTSFKRAVFEYVREYVNPKNFFDYLSKKYENSHRWIVVDIDEEIKRFKEMDDDIKIMWWR